MNAWTCSVVIATMSRAADLDVTMGALAAGTVRPQEVIVVDASADYHTENAAASFKVRYPHIAFHYVRSEASLPRQRNAGLERAQGDVVLFLDDDVTPAPTYLAALLAVFDDAEVGGACGVITNQPRIPFPLSCYLWFFRQVRYGRRSFLQRSGLPTFLYQPRAPRDVGTLTGCGMGFRRAAVARFDERINYFDDDDAALTTGRDWRLVQTPAARLEHRVASGARPPATGKTRRRVLEQRILHRRHLPQNVFTIACYYYSVVGAIVVAALRFRPRVAWATLRGLGDVLRAGAGVGAAAEKELLPKPE